LGIGDWAQSPIPNPQSPIPNPQSPIFRFNINIYQIEIFYGKIKNLFYIIYIGVKTIDLLFS
jgi:hypothetical protein